MTTMDVSQFTGGNHVLVENYMQAGNEFPGLIPDFSVRLSDGDTFNNSTCSYMFRSCCCIIIVPTSYVCSILCCVGGVFESFIPHSTPNHCCDTADTLFYNTTQWGKHTYLYENCCAGKKRSK